MRTPFGRPLFTVPFVSSTPWTHMARRTLLAVLGMGLLSLLTHHSPAAPRTTQAQGAVGWNFQNLSGAMGSKGARRPGASNDGSAVVLEHDGNLDAAAGNAGSNPEIFAWRQASGHVQLSSSQSAKQSHATLSTDGSRTAFVSTGDLAGNGRAMGQFEVFVAQPAGAGAAFSQISSSAAGQAETPVMSRDGRYVAFWHSGDLVAGQNTDGSFELFRADLDAGGGGAIEQLTSGLAPNPYHSAPSISDDGSRIAFVLEADIAGQNPDGSWELFLWEAGVFRQLTNWQPAMGVGRTLLFPSISGDGQTVVFAGEGHVDASLPGPVVDEEIFRWREGVAGSERLTTATSKGDSSFFARVSRDGRRVVFLSLSNFAGTNDNDNAELFAWDEGGAILQVSEGQGRWNFSTIDPELAFGLGGGSGTQVAFVSEKIDDPSPLMRTSPRGYLFYNPEPGPPPMQQPVATPTPEIPTVQGKACPQIVRYVPRAVIDAAIANPPSVDGWMQPTNPALPPGFNNPPRIWLSLRDYGKPFGPFNGVVWKPWCP